MTTYHSSTTDTGAPRAVTDVTLDVAVNAMAKYKLITKGSRTVIGQALVAYMNGGIMPANEPYVFTPFPRKLRRAAMHIALRNVWDALITAEGRADLVPDEMFRLVNRAISKNIAAAGVNPDAASPFEEAAAEWVLTSWLVMGDRHRLDQYVSGYDQYRSVMVRPIEIIRAEQEAEAKRIRAEHMAEQERAEQGDDLDDDDDDWNLNDDD